MKKYNDPFNVVTLRGTADEIDDVRSHLADRFGITGGSYVEIGRRDFGILGAIHGFSQPNQAVSA